MKNTVYVTQKRGLKRDGPVCIPTEAQRWLQTDKVTAGDLPCFLITFPYVSVCYVLL